MDRELVSYCH